MKIVSVVVPCRNEMRHIAAFCAGLRRQRLPDGWTLEAVIADGASDDGTRTVLAQATVRDRGVLVVDNPGRIVSTGLNAAIASSRGHVVVRMDVHTTYADDYVAQCIAALTETGADNVGGPWKAEGEGVVGQAIAAAFQSRWLSGGARSRQLDHSGWVDTVYLGAWPRATFERFGLFDETLVRNQDDEHNLRIVRGGGRVWQDARIRSAYRPRDSISALFEQYLQYGYWKPYVMRKHGQAAALRQLVPGAFVAMLALAFVAAGLGWSTGLLAWLGGAYAAALGLASVLIAARHSWRLLPFLPPAIAAYHLGYGLGTLLGWADVLRGLRAGRPWFARLTR